MEEARHALMPDTQVFRDFFNPSPIGIAVENLEGQPLFVNRAFCSMLGFTEEELRTKHCVDFSPPEDAEKDWALFQQLRAGLIDHYQIEKRYFRRDGSLVWGSLSISLLKGSSSPLVLAMVEDITDKKKAEETRFRYAAVIESSGDAIASGTLDGIIVSWNTGAQKIYGYTEAEAVGKPISMLVPPELPDEENKILETLKAGGRIEHFETVRVSKTGKRINVSLSISPIKDSRGRTVGVAGIARDITERKRAEEALRASEELLKTFVKNVPAAVAMLDREMRYLQVSDRWCTDYLSGRDQILGHSHYEIFPDMPERWKEVHHRGLQGETLRVDEDRWDGQDGPHWARWEVRPWKTPEGIVGGILILAEDITRRKRMEEMLSSMSRKLIESQEQERARIARELHDDINQRVALLAIEIEGLERRPEAPSEIRNTAHEISERVKELCTDIQALSHELHSSKLEYHGIVGGMRSWCREFGERQGMQIEFKHSGSLSSLPSQTSVCLFRVLQEALHNSAKHSGVKNVDVQLRAEPGEVQLTVHDLGKGFDVAAAMQGRGLGVTSMLERVRLLGGTVTIDSKPHGGTTIFACIPLEAYQTQQAGL